MIRTTPLDAWIADKTAMAPGLTGRLFSEALADYQIDRLNETIEYARTHSPFYHRLLASIPAGHLTALFGIAGIPFTTPGELAAHPYGFLAVKQDEVARIVTLPTS